MYVTASEDANYGTELSLLPGDSALVSFSYILKFEA